MGDHFTIRQNRNRIQNNLKFKFKQLPIKTFIPRSLITTYNRKDDDSQSNNLILQFLESIQSSSPTSSISNLSKTSISKPRNFYDYYTKQNKIGQGAHGVIKRCINIESQKIVAVKIFRSGDSETLVNLKKSFFITKTLKHKHLRETYQLFIDENKEEIHLVMEFINYPSLKSLLRQKLKIDQDRLKRIIKKILSGLKYLHKRGIVHRDIKPDNILYDWVTEDLKIIDFQISKLIRNDALMWTMTGTLHYKAPEMFTGCGYKYQVDIWALGVTLFQLASGNLPFQHDYQSDTIEAIMNEEPKYTEEFNRYSKQLQEFLIRLLKKNPEKRLLATQSLRASWLLSTHQNNFQNRNSLQISNKIQDYIHSSDPRPFQKYESPSNNLKFINRMEIRKNLAFDLYEVPRQIRSRQVAHYD